jgi:hypothetical protein
MIDLARLNDIAQTVLSGEYHMFLSMYRGASGTETVRCTLEKGSTYSKFHLKVEATGETPSEAFENALRQFPLNPLVGHWDTQRLEALDGDFTEIEGQ